MCVHLMSYQGLYSLSGKTSYRQISWSLVATRLGVLKESIKTTSMENVSTGVLEKIKNNI